MKATFGPFVGFFLLPLPNWDVGPGETSSFPTKWISADGTPAF